MQDEVIAVPDEIGRGIRNQQVYKLAESALAGLMVGQADASEDQIKKMGELAVIAAKSCMRALIRGGVL